MSGRRSIFEEVSGNRPPATAPSSDGARTASLRARRAARLWLVSLFALVVIMVIVGGLTRLTGSGLSITEWRPVTGAIPPLSADAWAEEFEKYRLIPQYQLMNRGMSLEEFKVIYWWEWGHRQLGRLIGLVWAAGFAALWLSGRLPRGWSGRFWLLGALGGVQGAIGWWMVASGLQDDMLAVAPYRLAVHLGLAFVILGLLTWYIGQLGRSGTELMQARRLRDRAQMGGATGLMHLGLVQILLGALVAGNAAGRVYVDWPLMHGVFFPPESLDLVPMWRNFFENEAMVQFLHRMAGYLLVVVGLLFWLRARKSPHRAVRRAVHGVFAVLLAQVVLGILTLMQGAPVAWAIAHQALAVGLWVMILHARFVVAYPVADGLRSAGRGGIS